MNEPRPSRPERKRKRRRRTVQPQGMTAKPPEINITPLIDVVLVLLIVFMVLTPRPQHELDVHLSSSEHTETQAEVDPQQVIVSVKGEELLVNDEQVSHGELSSRLSTLFDDHPAKEKVVFVLTSDDVPYAKFVEVVDVAKLAGAQTVGFATDALP